MLLSAECASSQLQTQLTFCMCQLLHRQLVALCYAKLSQRSHPFFVTQCTHLRHVCSFAWLFI